MASRDKFDASEGEDVLLPEGAEEGDAPPPANIEPDPDSESQDVLSDLRARVAFAKVRHGAGSLTI